MSIAKSSTPSVTTADVTVKLTTWLTLTLPMVASAGPSMVGRVFQVVDASDQLLFVILWMLPPALLASPLDEPTVMRTTAVLTAVVLYLLDFLAIGWPLLKNLAWISPLHYYPALGIVAGDSPLGRNLAILVEVAARNQLLRMRGINAARELAARLDASLAPDAPATPNPHDAPAEDEELA